MIGPHHSNIASLTGRGQGAAAWMATRWADRSKRVRSSSGSLSIRENIVGTHWLWVQRCRSSAASASSGSKWAISTTVPPRLWVATQKPSGAAW